MVSPNARGQLGRTALYEACVWGDIDVSGHYRFLACTDLPPKAGGEDGCGLQAGLGASFR